MRATRLTCARTVVRSGLPRALAPRPSEAHPEDARTPGPQALQLAFHASQVAARASSLAPNLGSTTSAATVTIVLVTLRPTIGVACF